MARPLYAIIGGMGPTASSEFLNYIYKSISGEFSSEQEYPRILLTSDSLAPDRKLSFEVDNFASLSEYILRAITNLDAFLPKKIIICCIVAHYCIKSFNDTIKSKIISITDLLDKELTLQSVKSLLLASPMTYQLKLINNENVVIPDESDIIKINEVIQMIKISNPTVVTRTYLNLLEQLSIKYRINSFALACSDLHLLNKTINQSDKIGKYNVIDSLELAAKHIINDFEETT